MFRKIAFYCISILLAVSVTGCSLFVSRTQTITINGQPSEATVVVNGRQMNTPATLNVRRDKSLSIVVTKEGYNTFVTHSGHSISPWGVLDIIGGVCFLFPFIGLIAPGAYELDQENFYYVLTPNKR